MEEHLLWQVLPLPFAKGERWSGADSAVPIFPSEPKNALWGTWKQFLLKGFTAPNRSLKEGLGESPG